MSVVKCEKCGTYYENGFPPIELSATGHSCVFAAVVQGDLAASEQRNRELTRQAEQLQAKVSAAEKLIEEWRKEGLHAETCVWDYCAETLASALTAPPSSSDPCRADTGREER